MAGTASTTPDARKPPLGRRRTGITRRPTTGRSRAGMSRSLPCQVLPAMRRNCHARGKSSVRVLYPSRDTETCGFTSGEKHYGTVTSYETDESAGLGGPMVVWGAR